MNLLELFLTGGAPPAPTGPEGLDPITAPNQGQQPMQAASPTEEPEVGASAPMPMKNKGMFGVKGGLRDVLGLIGDAFLVQGGADPIYGPKRKKEKLIEAMQGYNDDPEGVEARIAKIDPDYAMELRAQRFGINKEAAQTAEAKGRHRAKGIGILSSLARAADGADGPASGKLKGMMQSVMKNYDLGDMDLGSVLDDDTMKILSRFSITPYQEEMLDIRREDTESKIRTREARLNKPPASRPDRALVRVMQPDGSYVWTPRPDAKGKPAGPPRGSGGKGGAKGPPQLPPGFRRAADGGVIGPNGQKFKLSPKS